jgi:hypothetical protein
MPKNTKTKKYISAQRKILLAAVIITLVVHGLLAVLFVYKVPSAVYNTTRTAGVTFMDLGNQEPEGRRRFLNWLEYHEPSMISAPNAKYGYNQLNPRIKFRESRSDRVRNNVLPEGVKNSLQGFEDLQPHEKPENASANNFVFHSFQRVPDILDKPETKAAVPETGYPLIKRDDKVLHLFLSGQLLEDAEKLKLEPFSAKYGLQHSKLLPRVMIIKSSGNRDFDLRILREISLQLENIAGDRSEFIISIQWRKKEADE